MTPQELADLKMSRRAGAAYDRALTNTEAAPMPTPAASAPQRAKRSAAVEEAIQEMKDAKDRKKISDMGYSRGGKVSSASRRADGIAQRGKTKGRVI